MNVVLGSLDYLRSEIEDLAKKASITLDEAKRFYVFLRFKNIELELGFKGGRIVFDGPACVQESTRIEKACYEGLRNEIEMSAVAKDALEKVQRLVRLLLTLKTDLAHVGPLHNNTPVLHTIAEFIWNQMLLIDWSESFGDVTFRIQETKIPKWILSELTREWSSASLKSTVATIRRFMLTKLVLKNTHALGHGVFQEEVVEYDAFNLTDLVFNRPGKPLSREINDWIDDMLRLRFSEEDMTPAKIVKLAASLGQIETRDKKSKLVVEMIFRRLAQAYAKKADPEDMFAAIHFWENWQATRELPEETESGNMP